MGLRKIAIAFGLVLLHSVLGHAQEKTESPAELAVLKSMVGVWDAKFEVWPNGGDKLEFTGTETNTAHGKHWISSDLVSEYMGQSMTVHSIVGYDLDQKKLVGTIVDHGPYAASMAGEFDEETKTVKWKIEAKDLAGNRMVQHTSMTMKSDSERVLVLKMPGAKEGEFKKMMQVTYTKRKSASK